MKKLSEGMYPDNTRNGAPEIILTRGKNENSYLKSATNIRYSTISTFSLYYTKHNQTYDM